MFKSPWTGIIVMAAFKIATLVFVHKALEYEVARMQKSNPDLKDMFTNKK